MRDDCVGILFDNDICYRQVANGANFLLLTDMMAGDGRLLVRLAPIHELTVPQVPG